MTSSGNSRNSNCSSAVAAVVEAITSRSFSISSSSSSSRSCNISSISICIFTLSLLKNSNSDGGDNSKIHLRIFSECPKTSDHNNNATPLKELLMLSLRAALRLIEKGNWVNRLISHTSLIEETSITSIYNNGFRYFSVIIRTSGI